MFNTFSTKKYSLLVGLFMVIIGATLNEWFVARFFTDDGYIDTRRFKDCILLFNVVMVAGGFLILHWGLVELAIEKRCEVVIKIRKFFRHRFTIRGLLLLMSLFIFLGTLELVLRTGWFDNLDDPNPIWIPYKYKKANNHINKVNYEQTKQNSFEFHDKERSILKKHGDYRIALLGDSFVWGDGVTYNETWGHKLENKINEQFNNVEILSWGKNGWSTLDEFNFLAENGRQFDVDMLIVGFTSNDPDVGNIPQKFLTWQNKLYFKPLRILFPNAFDMVTIYANNIIRNYIVKDYGYNSWETRLYAEENLTEYGKVLESLAKLTGEYNIPILFVLTPNSYHYSFREKFDKIISLLNDTEIEYFDLFPVIEKELSSYSGRELWANPANGHPGKIVADIYVREVYQYLLAKKLPWRNVDNNKIK